MNAINFDDYLFRCSSLGNLMTGVSPNLTDRQKAELKRLSIKKESGNITDKQTVTLGSLIKKRDAKPELSQTVKNYLSDIHKAVFFGREYDIEGKYLDKGIQAEEKSITLYSEVSKRYFEKNREWYKNEYISGTPDNVQGGVIRDIKTSWTFNSFPLHDTEVKNKGYYWQLQGYMELTGCKEAELLYCLVDTPFNLIEDELRRHDWKNNITDVGGEVRPDMVDYVKRLIQNHIYTYDGLKEFCHQSTNIKIEWFDDFTEIPAKYRVKRFTLEYDKEAISSLYEQIKLCREYLNGMTINMGTENNITE